MALSQLALALRQKQKEKKLSITALAKAIGAGVQSVTGVLKGKSSPNKSTAPKYAKFFGISAEEFAKLAKSEMTPAAPAKGKVTKARKSKVVKAAKTSAKPKDREITLAEAAELAADALAVATHRATAAQRKVVVAVLGL